MSLIYIYGLFDFSQEKIDKQVFLPWNVEYGF